MKIMIIECTAEELSANRTVMDNINRALNRFTDSFCGVSTVDFARALANVEKTEDEEEESEEE